MDVTPLSAMPQGYVVKAGEIGVHVEGQAVIGDTPAYLHTDGSGLLIAYPHTGKTFHQTAGDAKIGQGLDNHLLQGPDVLDGTAPSPQVKYGVGYKLPGP